MRYKRRVLGLILLIILFLLMIYSSLEYEKKQFDIFYLFENQDSDIILTGEIKDINFSNKIISLKLSKPPYSLKEIKVENLESLDYIPKKGDIAEILVNEKDNLSADKILVYERWKHDLIYIRSLPAIPFVL